MPSYRTTLLRRATIADNTLAIYLARPPAFSFAAGQFAEIGLLDPPFHDLWGDVRTFSIVSAPFEAELEFVMRFGSTAYKRALREIPLGTAVELKGPGGSFGLGPADTRPAVLIAGGVGIAPFLSMLRQAAHDGSPREFCLFYSNHERADSAYLDELEAISRGGLRLRLIPTVTRADGHSSWSGERGHIDAAMLRRHLPAQPNGTPAYYLCGPSRFVSVMTSVLTALDLGEYDVQVEDFGDF